jgi:deglycase
MARRNAKVKGRKVAFLVAPDAVEQIELTESWEAVKNAGGTPELLYTDPGDIHLDQGETLHVDQVVSEARASDYDMLVLVGGGDNLDFLSKDPYTHFVGHVYLQRKPVVTGLERGSGHIPNISVRELSFDDYIEWIRRNA